jgi:hypothetical protein
MDIFSAYAFHIFSCIPVGPLITPPIKNGNLNPRIASIILYFNKQQPPICGNPRERTRTEGNGQKNTLSPELVWKSGKAAGFVSLLCLWHAYDSLRGV